MTKTQLNVNFLVAFYVESQLAHCIITINDSDSDSDVTTPANGKEDVKTEQYAVDSPGKIGFGDTHLLKGIPGHFNFVKLASSKRSRSVSDISKLSAAA